MIRKLALLLPCCCLALAGCLLQPIDAPALLDTVLQDKASFRPSENDALLDVAPGTPVDALQERLAGCWGKVLDDNGAAILRSRARIT